MVDNYINEQVSRKSNFSNPLVGNRYMFPNQFETFFARTMFEFRGSYGETYHNFSRTDLRHTIEDKSISIGIGNYLARGYLGNLDLFMHMNYSRYGKDGNGHAFSPIFNLTYSTNEFFLKHGIYTGIGMGLGRDNMKIDGYTNNVKWTLDAFFGLQFYIADRSVIKYGILARHKSHSFVGPWQGLGNNIGYNGLMIDVTFQINPYARRNVQTESKR